MSKSLKIVLVFLGLVLLVLVRLFEESLFYDPLLKFFKTDHTTQPLPDFEMGKLLGHTLLRYLINGVISIGILWVIFQKKGVVTFSVFLYGTLVILLITVFFILVNTSEAGPHLLLFYVRRFLIQPLFLLLLVPAFYMQRLTTNL
ncbi:exosortase F system-associated membrane protein [Rasiella sp. SM2506]|uniref:exosortase F system-associated membrane protein n=1 Tax=Rasiella sp. SM2506 TaxID=3423914 RepID=UPI003D78F0EA